MLFRLIVIWLSGEQESHDYTTREDAEQAERFYYIAFGKQVSYTWIKEI